jgi:hypothetical protein
MKKPSATDADFVARLHELRQTRRERKIKGRDRRRLSRADRCNRYRWVYGPEEFLRNLRLGVWLSTHMARKTTLGKAAVKAFCKHDSVRESRRKKRTMEFAATATAGGRQ